MYIFVCKGNLYRSRMASAFFTHLTGLPSESYGTHAYTKEDVDTNFIFFAQDRYKLYVGGAVRQISLSALESATKVYYMSDDNMNCLTLYPLTRFDHIKPLKIPSYHSKNSTICMEQTCIVDPGYKPTIPKMEKFCQDIHDAIIERWVQRNW